MDMMSDAVTATQMRNEVVKELSWREGNARRRYEAAFMDSASYTRAEIANIAGRLDAIGEILQTWKDVIVEGKRWEPTGTVIADPAQGDLPLKGE
jgi:hypothetical protein